jgi:hypothetical protein
MHDQELVSDTAEESFGKCNQPETLNPEQGGISREPLELQQKLGQ